MQGESMNGRIGYFDFWRGVAIAMVVGIHTFVMSQPTAGVVFVRQLLNCAVPIFLALSGYFATIGFVKREMSATTFWKKQIPHVYIPCIVWSLPLFAEQVMKGGSSEGIVMQILLLFVGGVSVYYFITLIIQYYLMLPWLVRHNNHTLLGVSGMVSFVTIAIVCYVRWVLGVELSLLAYAAPFTTWWIFFMLGVYMAQHSRQYSLWTPLAIAVIGMILQCIEGNGLMEKYGEGLGIKPSSYLYSSGVILLIFCKRCEQAYRSVPLLRPIEYCGRVSLGIFLIHCYMIGVAKHIPLATTHWGIKWVATLLLSGVFIWCANRVLPKWAIRLIGLS